MFILAQKTHSTKKQGIELWQDGKLNQKAVGSVPFAIYDFASSCYKAYHFVYTKFQNCVVLLLITLVQCFKKKKTGCKSALMFYIKNIAQFVIFIYSF